MLKVRLLGRPNVGKSTLMNALLGRKRSLTDAVAHTTRDEVRDWAEWEGVPLELIDTEGITDPKELLVEEGTLNLFVVEAGNPNVYEEELFRKIPEPKLLVFNKAEGNRECAPFGGVTEWVCVSAIQKKHLDEIQAWCLKYASPDKETLKKPRLRFVILGPPNVGKSTLMNKIAGQKIARVSSIAHTTRDPVKWQKISTKGSVEWVDTAGVRRRRQKSPDLEKRAVDETWNELRKADVVFALIDARRDLISQDIRLLGKVNGLHKPVIVLLNFWDQLKNPERKAIWKQALDVLPTLFDVFHLLPISALRGFNVPKILPLAEQAARESAKRVSTSKLNRFVKEVVTQHPPPSWGKHHFNILYASQVKAKPPTIVFFMNRPGAIPVHYRRYLNRRLQKYLGLKGQSIQLFFRAS